MTDIPPASPSRWLYAIHASMADTQAVVVILGTLLEIMVDNEKGVVERSDEEFLHDFRVAIRRTRSALSLFAAVLPSAMLRRGNGLFKDLGRRTTQARDLDVFLSRLPEYVEDLPEAARAGIEPLTKRALGRNARQYGAIRRWLDGKTYRRQVDGWRSNLGELAASPGSGRIVNRAAKSIRQAANRSFRQIECITREGSDADFHRLRILFKKLRYALEFSRSLTPGGEVESFVGHLKQLQDELGTFQDLVVHRKLVVEIAADSAGHAALALTADRLAENLRERRSRLKEEIVAGISAFEVDAERELERALAALR